MGMRDKKAIGLPFLAERWAALAPCIAQRGLRPLVSTCFERSRSALDWEKPIPLALPRVRSCLDRSRWR